MKNFKGKRMVEEELIQKLRDLQPGGGGEYTAGNGIDITDNEISIDDTVVATKTDLEDYELKSEAFSGSYNDLTDKPTIPTDYVDLSTNQTVGGTKTFSGNTYFDHGVFIEESGVGVIGSLTNESYDLVITGSTVLRKGVTGGVQDISLPTKTSGTYTLATTDDIPTIPTNVSSFTNDAGYITSSALSGYATETYVDTEIGALSIPTTATSTSSVTPSTVQLTFTYSDNTTETITLMTGASVSTTTTLS